MSKRKQADPAAALQLKFAEVNDLIRGFEKALSGLVNQVDLASIEQIEPDPVALIHAVRLQLSRVILVRFSASLIAADLNRTQDALGESHLSDIASRCGFLNSALDAFKLALDRGSLPPAVLVEAALGYRDLVRELILVLLRPARILRDEYIAQLARSQSEIPKREKKRQRDVRLRALRREHPKMSHNEFVALAEADSVVRSIGEPVTYSIVREATQRPRAGKSRS